MRGLDLKASRNRRSSVPTKLSVHLKARKLPQTSKPLPGVLKILCESSLTSLSGVSKLNFHMEIDFHSHWSDLSFWIGTAVVWRKVAKVTTKCWSVFCLLRQEKVITDPNRVFKTPSPLLTSRLVTLRGSWICKFIWSLRWICVLWGSTGS